MDPFTLNFSKEEVFEAIKRVAENQRDVSKTGGYPNINGIYDLDEKEYKIGLKDEIELKHEDNHVSSLFFTLSDSENPNVCKIDVSYYNDNISSMWAYAVYVELLKELGLNSSDYDNELRNKFHIEKDASYNESKSKKYGTIIGKEVLGCIFFIIALLIVGFIIGLLK